MNSQTSERDHSFLMGLLTGTVVGAGLMMWLAPRTTSEIFQRMADSAKSAGTRASEQYQQARVRVGDAVDELARKGQGVRDGLAEAVARGAREVERGATAAKSGPGSGNGRAEERG